MQEEKTVARVNGREIGKRLLRMVLVQAHEQYAKTGRPLTADVERQIEREAIDQLIGRELLYEESIRRNCHADDSEVERQIEELADQAGGMLSLTLMLARRGMRIEEVRDGIRRDLAIDAVVDLELGPNGTVVPEEEAREFFEAHRAAFKTGDRSTVSHISIGLPRNAYPGAVDKAADRLARLRERIVAGEPFDDVGRRVSEEEDGIQSGILGPLERGTLCTELDALAFGLPISEISDVVRSSIGMHLMRVVAREAARELEFREVLTAIVGHLGSRRRAELVDRLTEELRQRATIEIL